MTRVVIIDDSPTARHSLSQLLSSFHGLQVVGMAESGDQAVALVKRLRPDIVTLDILMPGQDAKHVVEEILATFPVPIVLVSEAPRHSTEVFDALTAGALDFVCKTDLREEAGRSNLPELLRALSHVKVRRRARKRPAPPQIRELDFVAIASSTGGPGALREILSRLPGDFPVPIVVAQHLAQGFEEGLARWLTEGASLRVRVARNADLAAPGEVLLGRPGYDILVESRNRVILQRAGASGYHPSGDKLFSSCASIFGAGLVGMVLTGIGSDGKRGAEEIVSAGGVVWAQDRLSSVVYGMPEAVSKAGLASITGSPSDLAKAIVDLVAQRHTDRVGAP